MEVTSLLPLLFFMAFFLKKKSLVLQKIGQIVCIDYTAVNID